MRKIFAEDKPKECRFCYFWNGKKAGCELGGDDNCYYRIAEKSREKCDSCPYGQHSPCIGWCTCGILKTGGEDNDRRRIPAHS